MNQSPSWQQALRIAEAHAGRGEFDHCLAIGERVIDSNQDDVEALLSGGAMLSTFGFLDAAEKCFTRLSTMAPADMRAVINLANVARDAGNHAKASSLYRTLLERLPENPVIRRNALVSLEYDPDASDTDRLSQAKAWSKWAIAAAGGPQRRPPLASLANRPLRIGYVSPDFCQHTVGLFVKDVLRTHDSTKVRAFAYSAGSIDDWVTGAIREACEFRDVSKADDAALAEQIVHDKIDVLVDLSGHTSGSRLTVFARRPAPVLVSWLGYFATTGLEYMDAVLLDDWHAPPGSETQFVEPLIRLADGRFCYEPVPWAPSEVGPPPCVGNGFVTFGSFNNTAKLNQGVFDIWSRVLHAVPDSRLLLKWRTFNDQRFRESVIGAFAQRGIEAHRIELRGPSFHRALLEEYAEIDIALDPFPFAGGLTSCESLWMGVPIITWPQSRIVSRQTFAFLSAIGVPELAARNAGEYVSIAAALAKDPQRLEHLRRGLRSRMQTSPLMAVQRFTRTLEQALIDLYGRVAAKEQEFPLPIKKVLHVGAGHRQSGARLPAAFQSPEWEEIRLDIEPANAPDIVGSMQNMDSVGSASVDAIYSAHNIEHVYAHEVPQVLKEFLRVLKPSGFLVVTCPDLQSVCAVVAEDRLREVIYESPAGPITPLDVLYGHGESLARGYMYMAHKCGFTMKTLTQALQAAGFPSSAGKRRSKALDLWVVATKTASSETELIELARLVLPA